MKKTKRLYVTNKNGISAGQMRTFLDGVPDDAFFDVTMIGVDSGTCPVIGLSCGETDGVRDKRIDVIWAEAPNTKRTEKQYIDKKAKICWQ